jgi:alpha-glucosidase
LLCVFNLSAEPIEWRPAQPDRWRTIEAVGATENWRFGGYAGLIARKL